MKNVFAPVIDDVMISEVYYYDHKNVGFQSEVAPESAWQIAPVIHKLKSFEHEREVRLIAIGSTPEKGISIEVDIVQLISEIWTSPQAEEYFVELIKSVVRQYGLDSGIVHESKLYNLS